jgi:hypothetical protein
MKYMTCAKKGMLALALVFGLTLIACNGKTQAQTGGGNADVRQAAEAVMGAVDAAGKAAAAVQGLAGGGKPAEASDFIYRLNAARDGVVITGIQKDAKFGANLVVPAEIEGFPVVAYLVRSDHDDSAARQRNQPPLVSVVLPDTIRYLGAVTYKVYDNGPYGVETTYITEPAGYEEFEGLGSCSFSGCKSLRSIVFPKNLTVLPSSFSVPTMDDITWPEALEVIGGGIVFTGAFAKLVIPEGVKIIAGAFSGAFTELVIPEGVKIIQGNTFSGNKNLVSVTLPDSLERIHDGTIYGAFQDCPELTTVNVSAHPITYNNSSEAFRNCPKLGIAAQKAVKDTGYTGSFR